MKRTASQIIRNLEKRISRLENKSASTQRKAGPGAGVEVCLSGDSRSVRCLETVSDTSRLKESVDRSGYLSLSGQIVIEDVTLASYYDAKHIRGEAAIIKGTDLKDLVSYHEIEAIVEEEGQAMTDIVSYNVTNIDFENSMESAGWTRSRSPENIEVEGVIEIEIEFEDGEYAVEEFEFSTYAKTTDEFRFQWDSLDEVEDDEDY